ncbi:hypothetical protein HX773_18825 [Pantoea sp. B9002]|uniref:hypothetical protein n=1 Tax=Pantoea sp. B9002 TaxID=2726979 RepID=UPI0015A050C4|nr:hypothetical protein [Pantoea sp. B9002]NWA62962.1 hypothetical protein [Pantoea sp. B9002]
MRIKNAFLCTLLSFFAYGCAMSPTDAVSYQKDNGFDAIKHRTSGGEKLSVLDLKSRYKTETNNNLPIIQTASCKTDDVCYYDSYAKTYDDLVNKYRLEKSKQKAKEEESCASDEKCSREKAVSDLSQRLRQQYSFMLSTNPYFQGDADSIFRSVCDASAKYYKNGNSKESLINNLRDAPGLGPQARGQLLDIASTCWDITKAGVNWNVAIR